MHRLVGFIIIAAVVAAPRFGFRERKRYVRATAVRLASWKSERQSVTSNYFCTRYPVRFSLRLLSVQRDSVSPLKRPLSRKTVEIEDEGVCPSPPAAKSPLLLRKMSRFSFPVLFSPSVSFFVYS